MFTHRKQLQLFSIVAVLAILFSGLPPAAAQGSDGVERQINTQTGKVSFIGPENGEVLAAADVFGTADVGPQDPAMALANRFGTEFGLRDPQRELNELKRDQAEGGRVTVRYQQNYEGVPVMGGELIVNTNENGDLYSLNGEVASELSLSTQPMIASEQARQAALEAVAKWYQKSSQDFAASEPELWVYDESLLHPSTRPVELVWRMEVTPTDPGTPVRELVLVNAQRGGVSLHFNQVDTAWSMPENTASSTAANSSAALLGATLYVATTGNDSNSCLSAGSPCRTINAAIDKAANGDTIRVAAGTYTSADFNVVWVSKSVTLSGGWNSAFTSQSTFSIVDGQNTRLGVFVTSVNGVDFITATIDHFIIQNGKGSDGGGVNNRYADLTITNSSIQNNYADTSGGGIFNNLILTLENTTVSSNSGGYGGGIYNQSSGNNNLTLLNSTISNNSGFYGGGIYNDGIEVLNNVTLSDNTAYYGGGLHNNGVTTLRNSILARNMAMFSAPDCTGSVGSSGYNLLGNNADCTFTATTGDKVGTSANPIDPRLTLLKNNGGLTSTHALLTGSPAIDSGNPAAPGSGGSACRATDQRGITRPAGTRCDMGAFEGSVAWNFAPLVSTYTANHGTSLPGSLVCTQADPNCASGDTHAKAAHKYAIGTYNLYALRHDRNSINNAGMRIISSVRYGAGYDNAFWNGDQMVYGDGFGYPLADDVVAHELTHGVTQYESNLFYYYQSGAINESFSDLWGEYYDQSNGQGSDVQWDLWQIGEDVAGQGALRNMSNPGAFADPDKMSSSNYYSGEGDNGGVHHNSGINNKAVTLMVEGGQFNGKTVSALGWGKTIAIYYEAQTKLLSSGADYSDLYYVLQQACKNLIGQKGITAANCTEVKDALDAVEMSGQPTPGFNTDAPLCDSNSVPKMVFTDDLEAGAANWTFSNGAYLRWQLDSSYYGPYAQSGLHSLYADDWPEAVTDASARLKAIFIPAGAYLHFAQAYGFEGDYAHFDGGVLEYSINNGATWTDAGSLMQYNGYDGIIETDFGNPLAGRYAFAGNSHGYISTRLNLASLAGKNVSFRWHMGLDSPSDGGYDMGWWVDNVKLYTCAPLPGAFNKTSPANGANTGSLTATLSWGVSSAAISYEYCYDTTNDGACSNWINNGVSRSKVLSGLSPSTTYYWQVRAKNSEGITYANGSPAAFWSFTTLYPPGAFNKTVPANGAVNQSLSLTLTWAASVRATSYQYCYDTTNDGACSNWISNGTATSRKLSGLSPSATYYWHVRALNAAGTTYSNGSPTLFWSFRTIDPPGAFNKTSPSNGSTGVSLTTTLSWSGSALADSYQYCYDMINDNQCNRAWGVATATTAEISSLGPNTTYYWQVRALNPAGATEADNQTWGSFTTTSTLPPGTTGIQTFIGPDQKGSYSLSGGQSLRESYPGVNNGPVKIRSTTSTPILGAERVIYKAAGNAEGTSFTEMMGLPDSQLDTIYWLPWYNNKDLDTQLRFANVSGSTATVHVYIGSVEMAGSPFTLLAGESTRKSFAGVNGGPVKIVSNVPIVAAERLIYETTGGVGVSFSEMMALPNSQLDTVYWLPWYNNKDLNTQLRFANVSDTEASVHVYIAGQEITGSPFTLAPGASTRQSFAGINNGPVKIESDVPIVAAERVLYEVNGVETSFTEMMALPNAQLDTTHWLPWYNNKDLDTQLRFANVSDTPATVHIYIGGMEMSNSPFTLAPGESTRQSFAGINNGPVQIVSDVPIVAAERFIYKAAGNINTSFSEMMALPDGLLDTTYWLPWYNNIDLDTQLRFGMP